jgi:hypothetical protein
MIRSPKGQLNPESLQAFEEIKKRFTNWRSTTRQGKRKIPEDLWAGAVKLSAWFSLSAIAQALGIDFNVLKQRTLQQQDSGSLEKLPVTTEFIELSHPVFPISQNQQIAEIFGSDGYVLKLYSGSVAEIIRAFKQS